MQRHGQVLLWLANERIRERIEQASRERLVARDERRSLRKALGNLMVALGRRLAAEPSPQVRAAAMGR